MSSQLLSACSPGRGSFHSFIRLLQAQQAFSCKPLFSKSNARQRRRHGSGMRAAGGERRMNRLIFLLAAPCFGAVFRIAFSPCKTAAKRDDHPPHRAVCRGRKAKNAFLPFCTLLAFSKSSARRRSGENGEDKKEYILSPAPACTPP